MATRYIALLRGINVSGQKPVKMDRLRALWAAQPGVSQVETYLQSGNVIFTAEEKVGGLAQKFNSAIRREFGFDVPVLILEKTKMARIAKQNPFLKENPSTKIDRLYVTFLEDPPAAAELEQLAVQLGSKTDGGDRVATHSRSGVVFLYCPDGYGRTKLSNTVIERVFRRTATTRNWKTVLALAS